MEYVLRETLEICHRLVMWFQRLSDVSIMKYANVKWKRLGIVLASIVTLASNIGCANRQTENPALDPSGFEFSRLPLRGASVGTSCEGVPSIVTLAIQRSLGLEGMTRVMIGIAHLEKAQFEPKVILLTSDDMTRCKDILAAYTKQDRMTPLIIVCDDDGDFDILKQIVEVIPKLAVVNREKRFTGADVILRSMGRGSRKTSHGTLF